MASRETKGQVEVEQLKRLIEIQRQIVELAKQNEIARRQCEALREERARDVRRLARCSAFRETGGLRRLARRLANATAALVALLLPPRMGT